MARRVCEGIARLAITVASVALAACNAGQGSETSASVQGNWSGDYTAAGSASSILVFALIQQSGAAYLFDGTGVVYALPAFTGSPSQSGSVTAYPAKGYTFADGSTSMQLAMQADTASGQMDMDLNGAASTPQARSGQAHLFQLETWYGTASVATGQWQGYYLSPSPTALALTVTTGGSFSGTDAYGCRLQGTLAPLPDQGSLFTASFRSTGSSPACGGGMTGLVQESAYDSFGMFHGAPGTYYYLCVSGAGGAFVAELKAP